MHNPESVLENGTRKLLWYFEIQTDLLISARRPDKVIINKKTKTCRIENFTVSADHKVKLKESEKKDNYQDLPGNLKKLWNMKVTVIPIVIGALSTVTKELIQELEDLEKRGRVENIQTAALLRSDLILRRVLETWGNLQSLKFQRETIGLRWCENTKKR